MLPVVALFVVMVVATPAEAQFSVVFNPSEATTPGGFSHATEGGSLYITISPFTNFAGGQPTESASVTCTPRSSDGVTAGDFRDSAAATTPSASIPSVTLTWTAAELASITSIGQGSKNCVFYTYDDVLIENTETTAVDLTASGAGASIFELGGSVATGNIAIADNDAGTLTISLTADAATVAETAASVTFTVTAQGAATAAAIMVPFTVSGDATRGAGITASPVSIPMGAQNAARTATITVPIDETDTLIDDAETVTVTLGTLPTVAGLTVRAGATEATTLVNDDGDDTAPRTLTVTGPTTVAEGEDATYTVSLEGPDFANPTAVTWAITHTDTTASDFAAVTGSIMFPTMTTFAISILDDDATDATESAEAFSVQISTADADAIGEAVTTTIGQDAAHIFSFTNPATSIVEGESATYTVARSGPAIAGAGLVLRWTWAAGASNPAGAADFAGGAPAGGSLTFTGAQASQTFSIATAEDALSEPGETFTLGLSAVSADAVLSAEGGVALPADLTVTIGESDRPVTLQIAAPGGALEEALSTAQPEAEATFTISFPESVTTTADITVNWRLAFPAAVAGPDATRVVPASAADFAELSSSGGTATIAAGTDSVDIMVRTAADLIQEPVESFAVELVADTASGGGGIVGSGLSISAAMASADATIAVSDDGGSGGVMRVDMASTAMAAQSVSEGDAATFSVQLVRGASTPPDLATDATNMPSSSVPVDVTYTVSITMQQGGTAAENMAGNLDIEGVQDCAGAAIAAADYSDAADGATIVTGCVRIPAGSNSQSFTIGAAFDNLDEGTAAEEMVVEITGATVPMNTGLVAPERSSTTADNRRTANINNVNTARTLAISATTASAEEGGDLVFTVTVEGEPVSEAFMVEWRVTAGAADISGDTRGMASFGVDRDARTQTQTIPLTAADDAESEAAETVTVTLTDPCSASGASTNGVCNVGGREGLPSDQTPAMQLVTPAADGTIRESDRPVTVQLTAPTTGTLGTAQEGQAADFTVSFAESVTTTAAVQVSYTITFPAAAPSATPPVHPASAADFASGATTGTVDIPVGMNTATLSITSTDDAVNEGIESYIVTLTNAQGGGAIAAPTLHSSDSNIRGTASISASDPVRISGFMRRAGQTGAVREGNEAEFTVSLVLATATAPSATSDGDICVEFQTTVLSMAPDNTADSGPDLGGITDCDGAAVTVSDQFSNTPSGNNGGVLIPAGQSSATFSIRARFDGVEETANEDMTVTLSAVTPRAGAGGASLPTRDMDREQRVSIENVNSLRTLEVSAAALTGDEDAASMPGGSEAFVSYTVGIVGEALTEEVSVDWSLAGADGANLPGAAASGAGLARNHGGDHTPDFGAATVAEAGGGTVNANGISGTLIFPVGATPVTRTVRVPLMQDALNEGAERLTLTVSDPCPATGVCTLGGGGGGASMTPALQLGTGSQDATIPASDPAMLRITRVGSGTVVSGEGITYQVSLGTTFLNGQSTPVLASAPLTVMVPLRVGGADSGQSFTVEVPTGQSSGQAEVPDTVIATALSGQTGTPMLSLGMASVTGAPGPSGSTAEVTAPDPTSTDPAVLANLPAPVQTAAWELSRTAAAAEAPEGGSYEITFTLRGSETPTGGLSFDWSVTGSAATDGGASAVAADFARAAGYTCGAAAVGATCTSLPSGTVAFTAGNTSQTIAIAVRDDSADNLNEGRTPDGMIRAEGFTLTFTALSGTDVARVEYAAGAELPGTPLQVDIPALRADLSVADATAAEGASAVFRVALSGFVGGDATIQPVVVSYRVGVDAAGAALSGDTATLGADYTAAETSLTLPAGESSGTIAIPLVLDGVLEPRETFTLTITGATGGGGTIRLVPDPNADPVVVAAEISATGTITDDADQGARRRQRVGALVTVLDRQTALLATDAISARLSRARTDSAQSASLSIANRNLIGARNTARSGAGTGTAGVAGAGVAGGATHLRGSSGTAAGAQDIGLALYGAAGQGGAAVGLPGAGGKSAAGRSAASRAANANAGIAFGGLGAGLAGNANLGTRTALPTLSQVLNGSSFRFGAASDVLAGLADFADGIEVWGSGGYVDLRSESRSSGLTYDGESLAAFIGADAAVPQLPNLLAGLAVGWSAGDLDFTDRAGGFEMRGKLENNALSVHPYFGWQLSPHANAWLVLGIGTGSVDIEENEGSGADAISRKLDGGDSSMLMFSTGITGTQQVGETGDLKLRFALTRVHSRVDSGRFDDGALLPKTRGRSLRIGGEAEAGRRIALDNGLSLRPFGTLRLRLDNASTESGVENAAMDWGAGIAAAWSDLGLDGRFAFRRQLNDTGDEEQGVSLDVNFAPGGAGQGIAISLQSALQQRRPGLSSLDGNLGDALLGANSALSNPFGNTNSASSASAGMQHSLSGEIAYGVALRYFGRSNASRAALLTPYGRFNLGNADTRWAAGLRLAEPGGLQLGLEAGLDLNSAAEAGGAAASPRSYDLLLTGRLRF